MSIFDLFASVTLTLSRWPSYTNLTYDSSRYTWWVKMNFLRRGFRKLSYYRHTYINVNVFVRLDYIVPRTRTKFGDRAFSFAGPTVSNSLPESVRSAETLASFKRKLKTYLFNWLLSLINIVMPSRFVFFRCRLGTKLTTHCIVLYC